MTDPSGRDFNNWQRAVAAKHRAQLSHRQAKALADAAWLEWCAKHPPAPIEAPAAVAADHVAKKPRTRTMTRKRRHERPPPTTKVGPAGTS
jgi:hypothetical protein